MIVKDLKRFGLNHKKEIIHAFFWVCHMILMVRCYTSFHSGLWCYLNRKLSFSNRKVKFYSVPLRCDLRRPRSGSVCLEITHQRWYVIGIRRGRSRPLSGGQQTNVNIPRSWRVHFKLDRTLESIATSM